MFKKLKTLVPRSTSEDAGTSSHLTELSEDDLNGVAGGANCRMYVFPWGWGTHISYPLET